jgi:hypothetical protein
MSEEQILQLVKEHFEEDWDENDGWEYSGNFDAFVKFARALYEEGYEEGYAEGYSRGYDVGEEIGYDRGTLDGE